MKCLLYNGVGLRLFMYTVGSCTDSESGLHTPAAAATILYHSLWIFVWFVTCAGHVDLKLYIAPFFMRHKVLV